MIVVESKCRIKWRYIKYGSSGEVSEPLLSSAISQITGSGKRDYKVLFPIKNIIDNPKERHLNTLIIDNKSLYIE